MSRSQESNATLDRIDEAMDRYPLLRDRFARAFLTTLHNRGLASVDEVYARARGEASGGADTDENVQSEQRLDDIERQSVWEVTREIIGRELDPAEVEDIILLTRKREEAQSLEDIAGLPAVSFGLLSERVRKFCGLPRGQATISLRAAMAARVALIRHFISDQLEFIGIARQHLTIRHFDDIIARIVGSDAGMGRIGGKAAGLLLAKAILDKAKEDDPEAPEIDIAVPESFFVRSDVLEEMVRKQGLWDLQDHKYRSMTEVRRDYPMILKVLKNADFAPEIVDQLSGILEQVGEHPLIVRSSSLLEDRFGAAFAGKYRSVFLPNQGPLEVRLHELLGAIAEIYASTLHPDPISYRLKRDLIDYDEGMAVLIQKVVGKVVGRYYLPTWAGVGLSRNEYRRAPRVRPEDGMARLVLGLGTRAVDRTGTDCPRVMALGLPTVRPEVRPEDITHYSQRQVDVINVEENRFETVSLLDLLEEGMPEGLEGVVSIHEDGIMRRPSGRMILAESRQLVVTFDRFAADSPFPGLLRWILQTLEQGYGCPVDIEFAFDGEHFHLLQCRPQVVRKHQGKVTLPQQLPLESKVFSASRDLETGSVWGIEYLVLIDPRDYDRLFEPEQRDEVARTVRALNEALGERIFALMGPGRWGSKDPLTGIRVRYSDINNARALIEVARRRGSLVPEVSFGSHFFQDLVESDILYLPLFPDEPGNHFSEEFLHASPNALCELVPRASSMEQIVRVIDVRAASGGRLLNLDVDGDAQRALAYLAFPE